MDINELMTQMETLVSTAQTENRAMTDAEVEQYEGLEKSLQAANKTAEIQKRQKAYEMPSVIVNAVGGKGDEVLERAFESYLRTGMPNADITELRAQSTSDAAGGYTIPAGFRQKLTDVQKAFGGIRSVATVINTEAGNAIEWPTLDDTASTGGITGEASAFVDGTDLAFGTKTLGAFKYTSTGAGTTTPLRVSVELLQDSAFDIAGLVARKLGQRIARAQAADFAHGAGTTEPFGLMTTTSNSIKNIGALNYAALNEAKHNLDPEYRSGAVWVMSDAALEVIEGLADLSGRPLLLPNSESGIGGAIGQGTLLGHRYVIDNGIVAASGVNYIAFGDMPASYVIRDVGATTVIANPYSRANNGQVEYVAWARADAVIDDRAAFVTVKDATP